jgi:hypothetical protein
LGIVVCREIADLPSDCTAGSQPRHLSQLRKFVLKLHRTAGSRVLNPLANKWNEGFTILEGVIALSIISVIGFIALSLPGSAVKTLNRSLGPLLFTFRALQAEAIIRDRVNAVQIPFWDKTAELRGDLSPGASRVIIPWYQGDPRGMLRISGENRALVIETTREGMTETLRIPVNQDSLSLSILRTNEGVPFGIGINCVYQGRVFYIRAPFAGIPLKEAEG